MVWKKNRVSSSALGEIVLLIQRSEVNVTRLLLADRKATAT